MSQWATLINPEGPQNSKIQDSFRIKSRQERTIWVFRFKKYFDIFLKVDDNQDVHLLFLRIEYSASIL